MPSRDTLAPRAEPPVVATGNKAIDLLLRHDSMVKEGAVPVPAMVRTAASSATARPAPEGLLAPQQGSLRDAMLREGADFINANARGKAAAEAAEMRAEAQLDGGGPIPPAAPVKAVVLAGDGDSWLGGLRSVLHWLREHRDWIGATAVALGLLGLLVSMWRNHRRMARAREQARRRRRDSRPLGARSGVRASTPRAVTRSALR